MHYDAGASLASAPRTAAPRSQAPILVLYLLDAFVIGGCVAVLAVRHLLLTIMARIEAARVAGQIDSSRAMNAAGDYLDILDHLIPYYLAYGVALLLLALLTLGVWLFRGLHAMRKR